MNIKENIQDILLSWGVSRYFIRSGRNLFFPKKEYDLKAISVEVSSVCNARCIFCNYRMNYRKKKMMSVADFFGIARSCIGLGYENIDLTCLTGDFFTHPNAADIIAISKDVGFKHVGLFTNAIAMYKHDLHLMLSGRLDSILISFPGFSHEVYRSIYGVDSYDSFVESVVTLLLLHKEIASKTVIVFEPRTNLMFDEIKNSDFYQGFLSNYLSERVVMRKPIRVFDTWGGTVKGSDLLGGMRFDKNPVKSIWPLKRNYLCQQILSYGILANGDVRLCNCRCDETIETNSDDLCVGNIYQYKDFAELLDVNELKIADIRMAFVRGKMPLLCKKCPFFYPVKL